MDLIGRDTRDLGEGFALCAHYPETRLEGQNRAKTAKHTEEKLHAQTIEKYGS